jgi:hypothetical protein
MQVDTYNNALPAQSITARLATATVNGTGVDLAGYEGALCVCDVGTFGGTTPTATVRLEDSDDNSTYGAVAAADIDGGLLATIDTTTDEQVHKRGYKGTKRYVRWAISAIAGTSPSLPICANVVRTNPRKAAV